MPRFAAEEIAQRVDGQLEGCADLSVCGVEQLDAASPDDLTFVRHQKNVATWRASPSRVALVARGVDLSGNGPLEDRAVIRVDDADRALSLVLELFAPPIRKPPVGPHASASVDPEVTLGRDVSIGPGCVIGSGAVIGDRCVLQANVCICDEAVLGEDCVLYPGAVIRERCRIGNRVIIHSNAVIGTDGFGYYLQSDGKGLAKIPHIGIVEIADDVEIGAGTCIDRGKLSATTIGPGTKIDNLCQIAHNCRIGPGCVLAGQVGLAGSVTLGRGVMLGGNVGVKDQVTIGDGASLAASSGVMDDVPAGAIWGGYPAADLRRSLREVAALRKLPQVLKELRAERHNQRAVQTSSEAENG